MKTNIIAVIAFSLSFSASGWTQEKAVCDSVHTFADNPAEYEGGMKGFYDYLKNFHYQDLGVDDPITGKFTIHFVLDKTGKAHNIQVTPETDPGLALKEFLLKMPTWKPATIKGEAVCIQMKVPAFVHFK